MAQRPQDSPRLLHAAKEAGAGFASFTLLRLPGSVGPVFEERLRASFPNHADKVMHQLAECRGGVLDERRPGKRMRGEGTRWRIISDLFKTTVRKLGFGAFPEPPAESPFRRPRRPGAQLRDLARNKYPIKPIASKLG